MVTVRDLLKAKGKDVWSVSPDTTMAESLKMLAEKNVGALVVMEGESLAGIVSERDFARKIGGSGECQLETPISEIMTKEVIVVQPEQSVDEVMQLMTRGRIRHLPVIEEGKLIGLISIGDIVKTLISDQAAMIDSLENYILGRGYGR